LTLVLAAGWPSGASAVTKGDPVARALKAYSTKFKFPVRKVEINLPGRQVQRTFVPILADTIDDFRGRFTEKQGCLVWRQVPGYVNGIDADHPVICFAKGQQLKHFNPGFQDLENIIGHAAGGQCMVVNPPDVGYLRQFWTKYHPSNGAQYGQDRLKGENPKGHCMWWLLYAEAADNQPLAHTLGVTRSTASSNLFKKLVHAGNDRVGPVGVLVKSVDEFNKMTDLQLLGPAPGSGAADAVR
jgi:hypothetical protein